MLEENNECVNLITSTAYWIKRSELTESSYYNLKSKLSVLNFSDQEIPIAFFETNVFSTDYVVIPKISINLLEHLVGRKLQFERFYGEIMQNVSYGELPYQPYEHQKVIIDEISKYYTDVTKTDKRVVLALQPGGGKTFISANIVKLLKQKFIFLVYSKKLVMQTYKSFCNYLGKDGMCVIEKGSDFECIDWSKVKGLFLSHSMLRSLIKTYSFEYVINVFHQEMGATIKILDEFDREVGMFYKLEAFSNFTYSLYLTGTAYKSLKPDDAVFQNVIRTALKSGGNIHIKSNRVCHIINYKFNASPDEAYKMRMWDEKLFKSYFNDYISRKDLLLDYIMKTYYQPKDGLMRKCIDENYKVVFFCGRIENCLEVKDKLVKYHGIDSDSIGIYNSSISEKEKLIAETKPFIITTCESMGRGYDNATLRMLVFLEFSFSSSVFSQSVSRTSRIGTSFESYILYPNATDQFKCEMNLRKKEREGLFEKHFKEVKRITVPDTSYVFYVNGYRADSDRAKEILEKKKKHKVKMSKRIF